MIELLNQLLLAVIEMRESQKEYFLMRDIIASSKTRHAERNADKIILNMKRKAWSKARRAQRRVDKIISKIEKQKSSLASLL